MPAQTHDTQPGLLLVDDDPSSLLIMSEALEADYAIRLATSGAQALVLIAARAPRLILLDMVMPELDGVAVLEHLRRDELTRNIPVLLVTEPSDAATETLALRAGADDLIHRPINPDVLRARVANHLEKDRLRRTIARHHDRLRQSEGFYRQIFEVNTAIKLILDPEDCRIVDANSAACAFYGYPPEQLRRMRIQEISAEAPDQVEHNVRQAASERSPYSSCTHRVASGEWRNVEIYSGPIERGGKRLLYSIIHDVTDRHQAERRVRQYAGEQTRIQRELSEARTALLTMIDTVPTVLGRWDRDERCLIANRAFADWFGQALEGMPGTTYRQILGDGLYAQHQPFVRRALAGETATFEHPFPSQDGGGARHALVRYLPDLKEGVAQGFYVQVEDVSLVVAAREAAERASAAKSAFLATMSHEIRTPLNAIIGTTYLLGQSRLDEAQQQDLRTIDVAGRNLLALIEDILDFSKIEANELVIGREAFSLVQMLHDLRAMFSSIATAKALRLDVAELPAGCPDLVLGDSHRVRQILINLLNNAIKFTPQGCVGLDISVAAEDPTKRSVRLCMRVTDTGIGIDAEALPKLFRPFIQADSSTSREFGGTGLGLSIVKRLAQLMGGDVGVESEPGVGSAFWAELPLELSSQAAPTGTQPIMEEAPDPGEPGHWLEGARVLAVDDSPMNLEVIHRLLAGEGALATLCASGEEAIAVLRDGPQGYDAVLMDLQMPGMDGCDTTRQIRQRLQLARLPIIGLTAGATTSEQRRAQEAGMNDFLTKPVEPTRLVRVLRGQIETCRVRPPTPSQPSAPSPRATADHERASITGWPEIAGIDRAEAAMLLRGDLDLFCELLEPFLRDNARAVEDIQGWIASGEDAKAAKRAHRLRGQAGSIGAKWLRDASGALEDALENGAPELGNKLADFASAHTRLFDALRHWLQDCR